MSKHELVIHSIRKTSTGGVAVEFGCTCPGYGEPDVTAAATEERARGHAEDAFATHVEMAGGLSAVASALARGARRRRR